GVRAQVEPREVEEREQVAVADVEEEVARAAVVAVLEDLGQWEAEHLLIEANGPLDVRRQQREVVDAARRRRRSLVRRPQVRIADAPALRLDALEIDGRVAHGVSAPILSRPGRIPAPQSTGRSCR